MMMKKVTMNFQEEQATLDHKKELTGDALPSVVQIENLEN